MMLACFPQGEEPFAPPEAAQRVLLYGRAGEGVASAGAAIHDAVLRSRFAPPAQAWDLLSIALSVLTADFIKLRSTSSDGWTRQFDLVIAVSDPATWRAAASALEELLGFLTTDVWRFRFVGSNGIPAVQEPVWPDQESVVLLSGGVDSLIGGIDRVSHGDRPIAVSHVVRGDKEKQAFFAGRIGGGLNHIQLNPNIEVPGEREQSQRARSFMFIALGVLAATSLAAYHDGATIPLYLCENGFIALNPPLTPIRIGSLSTRTAHPFYLQAMENLLLSVGLRVELRNPYRVQTKGEMMTGCAEQRLLQETAHTATSCGKFKRHGYKHCGRCVPCQVRRAAFLHWGYPDMTEYVYANLGTNDAEHAGYNDVRAVAAAIEDARRNGLEGWLGPSLAKCEPTDRAPFRDMVERGLAELSELHRYYNVQ